MACGWRWPRMTRCCARRSSRTAASCSSTPVTGCAPRSPRRRSAVDAAVAAQRALELPVRMGLATGEAELRDGDYFGTVLNRAARVMAAGHGGQILLADSTAGLLSGVDLQDLGPRRLRDVPNPVEVFQVQRAGPARKTFRRCGPSTRVRGTSVHRPRASLGASPRSPRSQAALRAHHLVTLTGVGGVGKTRLALEVAAQLVDEFPDGVWLFELAAVTDPAAVPDAVAAVLGITQQPGKSVSESVAAALEGRVRLLVIDNCEHVLDAAADLIDAILAQSATVKILATSRQGLGVADEQLWPVPSLDVVAGTDSPAVDLFVERSRAVAPRFSMTDEVDAMVEICQRLDGIPLAIELAASRMASMTASEMRDHLDDRFRLLVRSRRGLERHQTLRHAVQWSHDLLDGTEKTLLARCSVFAGGFDLAAPARAVGRLRRRLAPRSMCSMRWYASPFWSPTDHLGGPGFRCWRRSANSPRNNSSPVARPPERVAAHARHFAGREADILAVWDSPQQRDAYDWFTAELANLRTAFRWAADHNDLDVAAPIATFAAFLGYVVEKNEPIAWAEELTEAARAVDHPRLAVLYVMASACYVAGRIEDAVRYADVAAEDTRHWLRRAAVRHRGLAWRCVYVHRAA